MGMTTICIVDDDRVYQITTIKMLERISNSHKILVFSDGQEAYQYITENIENANVLPDIILLDINMPNMNAWEFLDAYAEIKPSLPKNITIYVISSSLSESDIQRAKKIENVKEYYIKPVITEQYLQMLNGI